MSVNSTLSQERHVYACAEGSVIKSFYVKMFLRKFCSLGQNFMQNHQEVPELLKENLWWKGCTQKFTKNRVYTKIREGLKWNQKYSHKRVE